MALSTIYHVTTTLGGGGGGSGEINTGVNIGTAGVNVFKNKVGVNLQFKKVNPTEGVAITDDVANDKIDFKLAVNTLAVLASADGAADYIVVYDASGAEHKKMLIDNLPTGGSGEVNTASNVGASGTGLFKAKNGVDLEFKNVKALSGIAISQDVPNNTVDFALDVDGLGEELNPDVQADFVAVYDVAGAVNKKVKIANLSQADAPVQAMLALDPDALYKFEEQSGTNLADAVGTNDLTLSGTVNLEADPVSGDKNTRSIDFLGTGSAKKVSYGGFGSTQQKFSMAASFNLNSFPTSVSGIVGTANGVGNDVNIDIDGPNQEVCFSMYDGATSYVAGPFSISLGTDYHVVATKSDTNGMRLYVNDTQVGTNAFSGLAEGRTDLVIGKHENTDEEIDGRIDNVAIWETVELTAANVTSMYNAATTVSGVLSVRSASNIGTAGVNIFKQKVSSDLEFKKINAVGGISITDDVGNNKIDIGIDIVGRTADATPDGAADFVLVYDDSAGINKKVLIDDLPSGAVSGGAEFHGFRAEEVSVSHASGSNTKIEFTNEVLDTDGDFDNATNYRHTPVTAGKWKYEAQITLTGMASTNKVVIIMRKNGTTDVGCTWARAEGGDGFGTARTSALVDMNGTTDYMECFVDHNGSGAKSSHANGCNSFFEGFVYTGGSGVGEANDPDTLLADTHDIILTGFATTSLSLSGATPTPDLTLRNVFDWSITANSTLNNPASIPGAGVWYVYATVDGVGGHTLAYGANYNIISGAFDGSANAVNILTIVSDGSELDVYISQR